MNIHYTPAIILSVTILVLMISIAYKRSHIAAFIITGIGLVAAGTLQYILINEATVVGQLFIFNPITGWLSAMLLLLVTLLWLQLYPWLGKLTTFKEEFYLLLLLATLGSVTLIYSHHFGSFFLALELMGLSFVGLIAYSSHQLPSQEAGIKYLVLSGAASALILMGIAIIYLQTGSLSFDALSAHEVKSLQLASTTTSLQLNPILSIAAIGFIVTGLAFKLSLVPCHLWVADIFEGAPLPTTALLAIISKLACFVTLWRLFTYGDWQNYHAIVDVVAGIAVVSMLIGNLLALIQQQLLRLLAFSSISHFGYLLLILLLVNRSATMPDSTFTTEAMLFYLFAYLTTLMAIFIVLMQLRDKDMVNQLTGLFWAQPLQAACLSLLMLSLAGIPLTVGFMGKFYLIIAAIAGQLWWPLTFLAIASVIGLFFYLRIIMTMLAKSGSNGFDYKLNKLERALNLVIIVAIVTFGTFPALMAEQIQAIAN